MPGSLSPPSSSSSSAGFDAVAAVANGMEQRRITRHGLGNVADPSEESLSKKREPPPFARDKKLATPPVAQNQRLSGREIEAPLPHDYSATTAVTDVQQDHRCNNERLRPLVAASIGCYGAALADGSEYRGHYGDSIGHRGLREWHKERLDVLAGADGVDFLLFETIPCLAEVRAVLSLLQASFGCKNVIAPLTMIGAKLP